MTKLDVSIFETEPADVYHAKAKEYLSSHQLIEFMQCPYLYQKRRAGLIDEKEPSAFLIGRAAHALILEGYEEYESQFAVGGPVNPSTGKPYGVATKKFIEWQESQRKPVISQEKAELISAMNSGVRMNPYAVELLQNGRAEGVVRADYCGVPCQIRADWFNPDYGIVDLKTCDDLRWFESDAKRFQYHHQLAFYQNVLDQAIGRLMPVYIIAVEKKEPFRCGVWQISSETLLFARAEIEAAIERLKVARMNDQYPTGYEELRILSVV
ncbi:MAG: PD-(D/E)XK nuclease-like domain-containing protein [Planctomycetaceae bacterium]|nr:PD-(D/E)XK nuclease-like domain-containing protein [Planctomycetaceae bacterium]